MPKRKREDDKIDDDEDRAQKIRKGRFRAKIEQGNKSITSALKLARGFERQKLGRRQKAAKNDPKELLRLREEIIALKALDLSQTAEKYLFKQLARTKRIKESATFVAIYGPDPVVEAPKPGAEANVVGRLFNSNPIKEVMPGIMRDFMGCLGIETDAIVASKGGKKNAVAEPSVNQKARVKSNVSEEDEFEGFSEEEDRRDLPPIDSGHRAGDKENSEDDEMADYYDRLASNSSTDSENASSGGFQAPFRAPNSTNRHSENGVTDDVSLSPSPPPARVSVNPFKPAKTASQPTGTTTFLPSLMMGGYYSGSDSDDAGDRYLKHSNDPLQKKQRKNRRGQRARQVIAEKKYGKNANHLKKSAAKDGKSRDAGWDPRRGATEAGGRRHEFRNRMGRRNNDKRPTCANDEAVGGRRDFGGVRTKVEAKPKKEGPLHPSWEAAKKRKEQSLGLTQPFSGRKTTFD